MQTNKISETDEAISKLLDRTEELIRLGKSDEAEYFLNELEKHAPHDLNIPFQRGGLHASKGEHEKALEQYFIVHRKLPDFFENINNIATAYYKLRKYDDAVFYYNRALELRPDKDFVLSILAETLFRRGDLKESIETFKRALAVSPDMISTHSNLLLAMLYSENVSPEDVTEEARKFGENIGRLVPEEARPAIEKDENRKIRIGYLSPDFRDHPVPYFLEPLLKNHNRKNFEVYAYSTTLADNPVMDRLKKCVDVWRDARNLDHKAIRKVIVEDKIDILIDTSGHTAYNNLKVFAQRAAPIQVTWLGYPATTGVKTMDYKITDAYVEPAGKSEHLNTEILWRLPHIFCCYQPHENSPDVIDHPPFEDNGHITFGCFNNFVKVRDPVLSAWAKILEKVPNSKLLLEIEGIEEPRALQALEERLKRLGIDRDRVILEPRKRSNQFVLYNKIDIALDPFPATGGTTSMDTLWMGVPFVTLAGGHFGSRMGVSILSNVGLPELIANNVEEYVSIVVGLAMDKKRLKGIRHDLRKKFASSPAMDQKSFARDMEEAYKNMWQKYCTSNF